jgi:hypothetical protein
MNVELAIVGISERGIQVALGDGAPLWLPKSAPGLVWPASPEIGDVVYVRVPAWLCAKHPQIQALRFQRSMSFHQPLPGLDPVRSQGAFPVTDSNDLRGAIFKNDRKESDRHPDYKGDITIDGRKYWLSGWIKEGKRGKYLSLAAKPAEDQQRQPERQPPTSTYAQSTGRDDRQRQPAGGPTFRDDSIPFLPDR